MKQRQVLVQAFKHDCMCILMCSHPQIYAHISTALLPLLLALQQLAVGGDLDVQAQLKVHQLLVFADLSSQVLLGPSQGLLQLGDVLPALLQVVVALCPHVADVPLQGLLLQRKDRVKKSRSEASWMDEL